MRNLKHFGFLHIILFFYSLVGIFSKSASQHNFLSPDYIKNYLGVIIIMGVYAVLWQQILKIIPLTTAYSHRAIITVWGVMWGIFVFHEKIRAGMIIGIILIIIGISIIGTETESKV